MMRYMSKRAGWFFLVAFWLVGCGTSAVSPTVPAVPVATDALPATPLAETVISLANVTELEPLAQWGEGQALQVIFDPTGRIAAANTTLGLYLYDAATWEPREFSGPREWVHNVTFAPDGERLAFVSPRTATVQVWHVLENRLLVEIPVTENLIRLAFSPDGAVLAGNSFYHLMVWQAADGALLRTIAPPDGYRINEMSFSADGALVAAPLAAAASSEMILWRTADGTPLIRLRGDADTWLSDGQFNGAGDRFAAAQTNNAWGENTHILVWELDQAQPSLTLNREVDAIRTGWTFDETGGEIAAAYENGEVVLWSLATGQPRLVLPPPVATLPLAVRFIAGGTRLAVAYSSGHIGVWAVADGAPVFWVEPEQSRPPLAATVAPDEQTMAVVLSDGLVQLINLADGQTVNRISRHRAGLVRELAFAPDGALLGAGMANGQVRLWQAATGELVQELPDQGGRVDTIAFDPDGSLLATGLGERVSALAFDDTVRLWDWQNVSLVQQMAGEQENVVGCAAFHNRVVFTPDGDSIILASHDFSVQVWRVADGTLQQKFEGHKASVLDLALSSDGTLLASASDDGTIRIWRLRDGAQIQMLNSPAFGFQSVALAPDGQTVVGSTAGGPAYLWHIESGELLHVLSGYTNARSKLVFSADGSLIAGGGSPDGVVNFWSAADGQLVHTLTGYGASVETIVFAPGGNRLAFGGADGSVFVWGVGE